MSNEILSKVNEMIVRDLSKSFNPYPKEGFKLEQEEVKAKIKKITKKKRKSKRKNR